MMEITGLFLFSTFTFLFNLGYNLLVVSQQTTGRKVYELGGPSGLGGIRFISHYF